MKKNLNYIEPSLNNLYLIDEMKKVLKLKWKWKKKKWNNENGLKEKTKDNKERKNRGKSIFK